MRAYLLAIWLTLIFTIVVPNLGAATPFATNHCAPLSSTAKMGGGNLNLAQAPLPPIPLPQPPAPPVMKAPVPVIPSLPTPPPNPPGGGDSANPPGGGDSDLCKGLSPEQRNQIPICKEDRP